MYGQKKVGDAVITPVEGDTLTSAAVASVPRCDVQNVNNLTYILRIDLHLQKHARG